MLLSMIICAVSLLSSFSRGVNTNSNKYNKILPEVYDISLTNKLVYHIQLTSGKHYIGITDNLNKRWAQHLSNKGSKWTKIYKPEKIVDVWSEGTDELENKITSELMDKYGINNVRGGNCHCPILKECKKYGCKYSETIYELDKIMSLLEEDWVREIIETELTYDINGNYISQAGREKGFVNKISDNVIKQNNKWYYNDNGNLNTITITTLPSINPTIESKCSNSPCILTITGPLYQI